MKMNAQGTFAGACIAIFAFAPSAWATPAWDRVVRAVAGRDLDEAARCARTIGTATVAHELTSHDHASRTAAVAVASLVDAPWTLLGALATIARENDASAAVAARHIATAMQLHIGTSLDAPATAAAHHVGREAGGTDGPGHDDGFDDGFDDDTIAERAGAIDAAATAWTAVALDEQRLTAIRVDAVNVVAELDGWATRHGVPNHAHLPLQRLIMDPSEDMRRAAVDVVAALAQDSLVLALMKPVLTTMIAHEQTTELILAAAAALCGDGSAPATLDGEAMVRLRAVHAAAAKSLPGEMSPTRRDALDASLRCVPDAAPAKATKAPKKSRRGT